MIMFRSLYIRRVLQIPLVVFIVVSFGFIILHIAPGDPLIYFAGESASPEYLETIKEAYGLDKPIFDQYIRYVRGAFIGDWGYSLTFEAPVINVILYRIPLTLLLTFTAFIISITVGVGLGIGAALKRYSAIDTLVRAFTTIFNSVPPFIIGLLLIYIFSVSLGICPLGGFRSLTAIYKNPIEEIMDIVWHLILPSISLALIWMAAYTRTTRNTLIEALLSNYVRAAISRGVNKRRIVLNHALRSVFLPIVTLAGVQIGYMMGGVILTETIFSWPGIGSLVMQSVVYRDFPLLMGVLFFSSIWVAITNLLVDISYMILDPRVRIQ
ncbi:MAG: ABC transporter permease [Nitrososphaeria archaeon]